MQRKEKINKIINGIGLLLILGSALLSFSFIYNKYRDKQETEKIIDEVFENKNTPTLEVEVIETPTTTEAPKKQEIQLTSSYLGYIEFSDYGIKRLITNKTDKTTLDKGLVGLMNISANLDDENGNIIMAGHSTSNVFQKLHYMKIGAQIKITTHQKTYYYQITEKHTINDNDYSYFKNVKDKKLLTLITCKNNSKQRLIVIAELRG